MLTPRRPVNLVDSVRLVPLESMIGSKEILSTSSIIVPCQHRLLVTVEIVDSVSGDKAPT